MSEKPQNTPALLQDIKVLDLSRILAGPWASQVLADFGATVWKIEKPNAGDDTRHWGPPIWTKSLKKNRFQPILLPQIVESIPFVLISPKKKDKV